MPPVNIEECRNWINAARPLLGFSVTKPNMIKRNEEVADLLKNMQQIVKDDPPNFAVLKTQKEFAAFQNAYKDLSTKFESLAKEADAINNGGKGDIDTVSKGLRTLKQRARLELGKAKPTANKKVEKQLLEAARFQPVYEDMQKSIVAALNRLKRTPGTQAQQATLQKLLDAGKAAVPDYHLATLAMTFWEDMEALQRGVGLRILMDKAYRDADALPENVMGKDFAKKVDAAYSKLSEYEGKTVVSQPNVVDGFYDELHLLHRAIEDPNLDKKKVEQDLADIVKRIGDADTKPASRSEARLRDRRCYLARSGAAWKRRCRPDA